MKNKKLLVFILVVVFLTLCISGIALADFGDFGGVSDFGGDIDFGGFSGGDYDSDYSGGTGFVFFGSGSGSGWIVFAIIIAIIIVTGILKSKKMKASRPVAPGAERTPQSMLQPISTFYEVDPDFNEMDFKGDMSNKYVQLQNCWTAKDISELRPYFTDTLYSQFDRQLDTYRKGNTTNRVDNISVMGVDIRGWYCDGENNNIVVSMRTRIIDYVINDNTGKIIRGDSTKEKFMEYEYTMQRPKDMKTQAATDEETTVNCPNCGAPLKINVSAKCPYCGSIVTVKGHDWIIAAIKAISQRTS